MNPDVIIIAVLLVFLIQNIISERQYYRDKSFAIYGVLSNIFLLLFLIAFYFGKELYMIIFFALGLVPGIYFQVLMLRKDSSESFKKIVSISIIYLLYIYAVVKILF